MSSYIIIKVTSFSNAKNKIKWQVNNKFTRIFKHVPNIQRIRDGFLIVLTFTSICWKFVHPDLF